MWFEASKSAVDQLKRAAKEAGAKKQQKWSPSPAADGSVERWRASRAKSMRLLASQEDAREPSKDLGAVAAAAQLRSSASGRTPSTPLTGSVIASSTTASRGERPYAGRQLAVRPRAKPPTR